MKTKPIFFSAGHEAEKIDVRLSYGIVRLFSEGLYASPNKAIEELVANSFDAGALRVAVLLPHDFQSQNATIAVVDTGEGMDASGLKQHWVIGKSLKRALTEAPLGRKQIGKFGIGKLASYVLANRLTHISRTGSQFYSTSMDFSEVDDRGDDEIEPKTPMKISLRTLTEAQAKEALSAWTQDTAFQQSGIKLFGHGAAPSWTFAILSDLKDKVQEIRKGKLEWVLRTALPLRDDFAIYLDGKKLVPSKAAKGRLGKWILGKDISDLPKPAPELESDEDATQPKDSETRFALRHGVIGRITGYAEGYHELLTGGKASQLGRSYGFFVYVLGRLINVEDGHFGIPADELRHGTFGRIRIVVHMDGLDDYLQSDRERVRQGPALSAAQNILRAIFNKIRPEVQRSDDSGESGARLSRKLAGSPGNLVRRPIIEMVRAALAGKVKSRYIAIPSAATASERDNLIAMLEARAETPEKFIGGIDIKYDNVAAEDGIAVYDAVTSRLRVNGLHPFVGAFFDEFVDKKSGLPLEVFAMAEILLEAQLHQGGYSQAQIDSVMEARDELLRSVAKESGRMTPLMVANALRNAKNDQDELEIWVVEAFRSLGFEATRLGGKGKPDGIADAQLAPDAGKQPQRYKVSLEAKSKEKDGAVSAKSVGVSTIARHRKDFGCDHAIVVGQLFPTSQKENSALAKEVADDRALTSKAGDAKTITLIHIDDLANLVQHRPVKALTLQRIRQLLRAQSMPEDCKKWIDALIAERPVQHNYPVIVKTIARLQSGPRSEPVQYGELRSELRHGTPKIDYSDIDDLRSVCERMSGLVPDEIETTMQTVALNQGVPNILSKLETATKAHLANI